MKNARKILASLLALVMIICMLPATVVASSDQAHKDLAREAIGEGIVLLKNNNNALPLDSSNTVALFGGGQRYTASTSNGYQIGGGGSGWVNMDYTPKGPSDVLSDLAADGEIGIYKPLVDAYNENVNYVPTDAMYEDAAAHADTAIMFITRFSSEGSDISRSNWYLSSAETTMLQKLSDLFENVVVLINAPSMLATDWSLDGNEYDIDVDALLITYMAGEMGAYGMADVLTGAANPSGKLVDTYAMDIDDYPTTETFLESNSYTRYTEDIYVGYRYFETFDVDVAYEFGYGMSYTTFDIEAGEVTNDGETITVPVTVTNTGDVAGKEVVQVYYAPPMAGEGTAAIHKSAINLAAYAKTDILAPGASQTLEISYPITDMASFDDNGASGHESCYVLEAGAYDILVGNSVKNNAVAGTYAVDEAIVVEELSELCPTNLDTRMIASVDEDGEVILSEETLNAVGYNAEPIPVAADAATIIECEEASSIGADMQLESFSSGTGFLFDGESWVNIGAGTVVGYLHGSHGQSINLNLNVAAASKYTIGFVNGNGGTQGVNAIDILTLSYSADGGATWTAVEGFSFDSPTTAYAQATTGYQWWNLIYTTADVDGNPYEVNLPAGENVILRLTVTSNAADGYSNTNLDKIVLVPEGVTYTAENVIADIKAGVEIDTPITSDIDLDEDHVGEYVIQLQDVADGTYTMEQFIAQMSYNELISFCTGYATGVNSGTGTIGTTNGPAIKYGIYSADTADGPAGLRLTTYYATYWPCSTLQACTWNTDLIEAVGENVGIEAIQSMVDIWLAPGMNIHRSPLCGRNFEYYSEDPLVTGKSAAALTAGVQSKSVAVTLKHFCVNNKEGNRNSIDSRVSEKALREIYLKGFEIAVKDANPLCIMTSYNYLNGIETSENHDLLHGIVRDEWGWEGLFMTDWGNNSSIVREINGGNNVKMPSGTLEQLRAAVRNGTVTRETLEENAYYILKALMQMPDFTINKDRVIDIAATGTNLISPIEFSRRAYQTRFEKNGQNFHWAYTDQADAGDGSYGFIEFTLDVEKAGEYAMFAVYAANSSRSNAMDIYVDGVKQNDQIIAAPSTGGWTIYGEVDMGTVNLPEGKTVLKIQANAGMNVLSFYATALDQTNSITVDSAECYHGDTVEIDVTNNYAGLSSVTAKIDCDIPVYELQSNSDYSCEYNPETNEIVIWTDSEDGFAADAVLFTMTFDIDNTVLGGRHDVKVDIIDATGTDGEWTILNSEAGVIRVILMGDVNLDGRVSNADVITLARYLVGLTEFNEEQFELADIDGNGAISNIDLVKLARSIVEAVEK